MSVTARAPGRVNLIGDHTDYTGGLVLPLAIDRWTTLTGTRGGDRIRLSSDAEGEAADLPLDIADPASVEPRWARLVAAVVAETGRHTGFEGEVQTTIPIGMGLSSSAALEVAVALAFGADDSGDADRVALARALQTAEHRATGVPCGVMDQLVALRGVAGHALLVDCGALNVTPVRLPADLRVVVVDSGVRRVLANVPYAERAAEVRQAAALLAGGSEPEGIDDPILRRRAYHLASENQRVRAMAAALTADQPATAGEILLEGHRSLQHDLETTTPTIDALVEEVAARPGVLGARLTGGGWGGMVVVLAEPGALIGDGEEVRAVDGATVELRPSATSG